MELEKFQRVKEKTRFLQHLYTGQGIRKKIELEKKRSLLSEPWMLLSLRMSTLFIPASFDFYLFQKHSCDTTSLLKSNNSQIHMTSCNVCGWKLVTNP